MSHIIKFTGQDLVEPRGSNGLSSYAAYYQRLLYREEIYPDVNYPPLDIWYDKVYYGRIDKEQNTILPNSRNLKQLRPGVFALDHVVNQFLAFQEKMKFALDSGICLLDGNSLITAPVAKKAYKNPIPSYNAYLNSIFSTFTSRFQRDTNQITNFDTFANLMIDFLMETSHFVPITLTNYLLGDLGSVFNTGIAIALDVADPGDDNYKYENWLSDPNFDFYVTAAKKYGFIIEKNIPWLMVADLFSNQTKKSLLNYKDNNGHIITEENYFDYYFYNTFTADMNLLVRFIINSYTEYVQQNPFYEEKTFNSCGKFKIDVLDRAAVVNTAFLTDKRIVDLYLQLRNNEAGAPIKLDKKLYDELYFSYQFRPNKNLTNMANAANYINDKHTGYIYSARDNLLNTSNKKDLDNAEPPDTLLADSSAY
jgi:hypothetical protein